MAACYVILQNQYMWNRNSNRRIRDFYGFHDQNGIYIVIRYRMQVQTSSKASWFKIYEILWQKKRSAKMIHNKK